MKHVAIIGAGPTGLAAALGVNRRGHSVVVLERDEVGAALRKWGTTRFFTPLRMNVSDEMRDVLGSDLPPDDALLTGPEMVDRVLLPLTARPPLQGSVRCGQRVIAIGRRGLNRDHLAGHPIRAERPFRIVTATADGSEETFEADVVIDASGGFSRPLPIGSGGLPARGERRLNGEVTRHLVGVDQTLRGKRILLIGHGHSAANAINFLDGIAGDGTTHVTWAVRTANRRPCVEVADDPLPERRAIVGRANALAHDPPAYLTVKRRVTIDAVTARHGVVEVVFSSGEIAVFDHLLGFTGYRPENDYLGELAVEISPVTEGGARLYRAISCVTDCLAVPAVSPSDLESGEPNFYFAGSRSYGRARTFLLQTGFSQLNAILERI